MRKKSIQIRNIKIGLDLDGVIIDHTLNKIKLAKQHGYFLKPHQTSSEIMKPLIPIEIYRDIQNNIYTKQGLASSQMKNAKNTLKKLAKFFPNLYIISRRGIKIKKQQIKFARKWLKNNNFLTIINPKNIFFVESDEKKDAVCKKLGINVYLDDKIKVLNNLPSVKYRILFDPYGHYYKSTPPNIKIVKTWPEFFKYLKCL